MLYLGAKAIGAVTSRAARLVSDNPRCPADGHRMRRPQYYERRNITRHTGKKVRKDEWWICDRGCGTGYPNQAVHEYWAEKERERELDKPHPVEPAQPAIEEPVRPAFAESVDTVDPNAGMSTCPWCADVVEAGATVCKSCKGNLAKPVPKG